MARTTKTKTALTGSYPALPLAANSADFAFSALTGSSGASGNQIAFDDFRALLVLVQNSDGVTAYTVTFTSKADDLNRTGDISAYSLSAGEFGAFFFEREGWRQSDGFLYLEGNNVAVKVAAFGIR